MMGAGTVGTEAVTASVVPQILDMASRLNLLVVVEGIEMQKQADYFRFAHCGILSELGSRGGAKFLFFDGITRR